uniref:Ig-like domain-containing protein n=1 Tax=Maylandia zebra TaxID=106582 RepID=A0A3P9D9W8_9CICH
MIVVFVGSLSGRLLTCICREDKVIQEQGDVIAAEGDTVTLGCRYETSDPYPYLFWYKQEINNFPKYVLLRGTSGTEDNDQEFPKDRFDAEAKKTEKSVPLKIQKLQLSDSAVYYCAVRPTVTGNSKTLLSQGQHTGTDNHSHSHSLAHSHLVTIWINQLTYPHKLHVFGRWEEAGVPGENPRKHGENMQTPHRKTLA